MTKTPSRNVPRTDKAKAKKIHQTYSTGQIRNARKAAEQGRPTHSRAQNELRSYIEKTSAKQRRQDRRKTKNVSGINSAPKSNPAKRARRTKRRNRRVDRRVKRGKR